MLKTIIATSKEIAIDFLCLTLMLIIITLMVTATLHAIAPIDTTIELPYYDKEAIHYDR